MLYVGQPVALVAAKSQVAADAAAKQGWKLLRKRLQYGFGCLPTLISQEKSGKYTFFNFFKFQQFTKYALSTSCMKPAIVLNTGVDQVFNPWSSW